MKLFCVTSYRGFVGNMMMKSPEETVLITNNVVVYEEYKNVVYSAVMLYAVPHIPRRESDRRFADLAMPGLIGDTKLPGTSLEAWEVLGIDRYKLFFAAGFQDIFLALREIDFEIFDELLVSIDLGDRIPLALALIAKKRNPDIKITGLVTETVRTREFVDLVTALPVNQYLCDDKGEQLFLERMGLGVQGERTVKEVLLHQETREGGTVGIFFDTRDEWQARKFLSETNFEASGISNIYIFPVSERARELSATSLGQAAALVRPLSLLGACREVISFRWDTNYCQGLPIPVTIIDYKGLNLAGVLAGEEAKVTEL